MGRTYSKVAPVRQVFTGTIERHDMTEKELKELRALVGKMPVEDLTRLKQTISAELDARHGKRKYSPEIPWRELTKR